VAPGREIPTAKPTDKTPRGGVASSRAATTSERPDDASIKTKVLDGLTECVVARSLCDGNVGRSGRGTANGEGQHDPSPYREGGPRRSTFLAGQKRPATERPAPSVAGPMPTTVFDVGAVKNTMAPAPSATAPPMSEMSAAEARLCAEAICL
jgi:hypothetical protein